MYIIDFSADIINKKVGVFIFLLKGQKNFFKKVPVRHNIR